jgi:hypothetical protein
VSIKKQFSEIAVVAIVPTKLSARHVHATEAIGIGTMNRSAGMSAGPSPNPFFAVE